MYPDDAPGPLAAELAPAAQSRGYSDAVAVGCEVNTVSGAHGGRAGVDVVGRGAWGPAPWSERRERGERRGRRARRAQPRGEHVDSTAPAAQPGGAARHREQQQRQPELREQRLRLHDAVEDRGEALLQDEQDPEECRRLGCAADGARGAHKRVADADRLVVQVGEGGHPQPRGRVRARCREHRPVAHDIVKQEQEQLAPRDRL